MYGSYSSYPGVSGYQFVPTELVHLYSLHEESARPLGVLKSCWMSTRIKNVSMYVFFTLNRSFYSSTPSTPSARADSLS